MTKLKFLRRNWDKHSRIGKGRKKKQVWRAPKGRHSKTRNKRKGYPAIVMIGFKQEKEKRNLVKKEKPVLIKNLKELENIKKGEIAVIGKMGKKKKIEIAKIVKEKGIHIYNLNVNKILKKENKKEIKTKEPKK